MGPCRTDGFPQGARGTARPATTGGKPAAIRDPLRRVAAARRAACGRDGALRGRWVPRGARGTARPATSGGSPAACGNSCGGWPLPADWPVAGIGPCGADGCREGRGELRDRPRRAGVRLRAGTLAAGGRCPPTGLVAGTGPCGADGCREGRGELRAQPRRSGARRRTGTPAAGSRPSHRARGTRPPQGTPAAGRRPRPAAAEPGGLKEPPRRVAAPAAPKWAA
jgi:hypothetical protein